MTNQSNDTHSKFIGYLVWFFSPLTLFSAHRFYYGKNKTGVLWLFTCGLFLVGWLVDLFLIPSMDREADTRYTTGSTDYTVAWALLLFLWPFGAHRFYMGKIGSGVVFLACSAIGSFFFPILIIPFIGLVYDILTLNSQVDELNRFARA